MEQREEQTLETSSGTVVSFPPKWWSSTKIQAHRDLLT